MLKQAASFFLTAAIILSSAAGAFAAAVHSEGDIYNKAKILSRLAESDLMTYAHKSELIGERRSSFYMASSQYQNDIRSMREMLINFVNQLENINSAKISQEEKQNQMNKIYQDAEAVLYSADSRTLNYISSMAGFMPSLTYQKFAKRFSTYYNSLNISGSKINAGF